MAFRVLSFWRRDNANRLIDELGTKRRMDVMLAFQETYYFSRSCDQLLEADCIGRILYDME